MNDYYAKARRMGAQILGSHLRKVTQDSVLFCRNCGTFLKVEAAGGYTLKLDPERPADAICDCGWRCCEIAEPCGEPHAPHLDSRPIDWGNLSYNELCRLLKATKDVAMIAKIKEEISAICHWH